MTILLSKILGVPMSAAERESVFDIATRNRSTADSLAFFRDGAQHNTAKSSALLGAQGIFLVVDIFALDHGWPRTLLLVAMLVMFAGSLLVMANLRGTLGPYMRSREQTPADAAWGTFILVLTRSIRFNIALYLTFLSIVLLTVAALTLAF